MIGSFNCCYKIPCEWRAKWNKKYDKKIGCDDEKPQRGLRAKAGIFIEDSIRCCLNCAYHGKDSFVCDTCDEFDNYERKN